jgi:hypothetical protein
VSTKFIYTHPDELVVISLGDDVRYNPQQPRDGDGKWASSGGMGGGAYESLDDAQRARVDRAVGTIQRKQEKFEQQGGTTTETHGLTEDEYFSLNDEMTGMLPTDEYGEVEAPANLLMMQGALESMVDDGSSAVGDLVQARDDGGQLVGLASYLTGQGSPTVPYTEFGYAGTTGDIDGAGSVMFARVVRAAAARGEEIRLTPLDKAAASYWTHMGFEGREGLYGTGPDFTRMTMPAGIVQAIAEKIG